MGQVWGRGPHLQLVPLDAPHAACGIAPGLLGTKDELRLQQLVGAAGRDGGLHLPQPLGVCWGVLPAETPRLSP